MLTENIPRRMTLLPVEGSRFGLVQPGLLQKIVTTRPNKNHACFYPQSFAETAGPLDEAAGEEAAPLFFPPLNCIQPFQVSENFCPSKAFRILGSAGRGSFEKSRGPFSSGQWG